MFYKINGYRFSFREFWWSSRVLGVINGAIVKLLRINIPCSSDDPPVDSLIPFEKSDTPLAEEVLTRFQPLADDLQAVGFHSPLTYEIIDSLHWTKIFFANYCHESGRAFARIHNRIWTTPQPPRSYLFPIFISAFTDGTFLVSTAGKPDMEPPSTCRVNRLKNAPAQILWESHQKELSRESIHKAVVPIRDQSELRNIMERYHAEVRDYHLRRGVFGPITEVEQQLATANAADLQAFQAGGIQHPEVITELNRLLEKKAGWGNIVAVFVVSLLMFLLIGAKQWSWKYTLILIPVLLVHELGHYFAMRLFHYRNLRMFFIPFLGAAVSGRHFNVPGWKKAIVSLMGPMPGVAIGVVLGCVGMFLHHALLLKIALVALVLNGFNLLPILPLDGGWVMHSVLFSRHYLLDIGFRVIAALAMLAASIFLHTQSLMYVGIAGLVTLPMLYRIARITADLRQRGISSESSDAQTVPPATADTIITEVKKAFPARATNKVLAQHTLNIFESLNSRPPHWLATVGFLAVQGASILMVVIFASIFVVSQNGSLRTLASEAAALPKHNLSCDLPPVWRGSETTSPSSVPRNTVIATFSRHKAAETAYQNLQGVLPATVEARLFGDSIMVALPANDVLLRKQWVARIQKQTTNVFVDSTNFPAGCSFSFIASSKVAATDLKEEINAYMQSPASWRLIPPWDRNDTRTSEQRRQNRLARLTYGKLQAASFSGHRSPEMVKLQKNIAQARREGDQEELSRLLKEQTSLAEDLRKRNLEKLKTESADKVDAQLVDLYLAIPQNSTNWGALAETSLAPRMGQLPRKALKSGTDAEGNGLNFGTITQNGLLVHIYWMSFNDVFEEGPALAQWLCDKGCVGCRYEFHQGFSLQDIDE